MKLFLPKIANIGLYPTGNCEQNCHRCYLATKKNRYHNAIFKDYKQVLTFLKQFEYANEVTIHCIGGEPLLAKEHLYEYVQQLNKLMRTKRIKLKYVLHTAGGTNISFLIQLLDDHVFDSRNVILTWSGFHGHKYMANQELSKIVTQDLQLLAQTPYAKNIRVRTILTIQTIDVLYQSVKYLIDLGFNIIDYFHINTFDVLKDVDYIKKAMEQIFKIYNYVFRYCPDSIRFENLERLMWCRLTKNYYPDKLKQLLNSVCNHWNNMLFIDTDGEVYPCPMFEANTHQWFNQYKFGDIYTGISNDKVIQFYTDWEYKFQNELSICNDCIDYNCTICKPNRLLFLKFYPEVLTVYCQFNKQERLLVDYYIESYSDHPIIQAVVNRINRDPYLHYEYIQDTPMS
jgi:uncharacterized protein